MTRRAHRRPVTAEEREHADQERRDKLDALRQRLEDQIAELVASDRWRAMLTTAARFHRYSWRNQMLIFSAMPDATRVAGYTDWAKHGRHVRKGERGIPIFAPVTYRRSQLLANDPTVSLGAVPADPDEPRVMVGTKVAYVFDISQTDGADLPIVEPEHLTGDGPAGLRQTVTAELARRGYTVVESPDATYGALDRTAGTVTVPASYEPAQQVKTLLHELAHAALDHDDDAEYAAHRGLCEAEAESVAYVVAAAAGLDASAYTVPYIARWTRGDLQLVKQTAQRVLATARDLIGALGMSTSNQTDTAA